MFNNMYQPYQPYQFTGAKQQLIKVNGIDGARAYQMPPNSTTALFDGNNDLMYIKTTDGAGFGTVRTFRFEQYNPEREAEQKYVTRAEFEQLKEMLSNGKQSVRAEQQYDESDQPVRRVQKTVQWKSENNG